MQLTLRELELHEIAFDRTYAPAEIDLSETNFRQTSPLRITGEAGLLTGTDEIRVTGRVRGVLEGECDRCLEKSGFELDRQFTLHYRPASSDEDAAELELEDEDTEIGYYEGESLKLATVLREQVLLWLPMHWVCHDDCKGFCPHCGANRNRETCTCRPERSDERWAALRDFKPSR